MRFFSNKTPAAILALILRIALGVIFVYAAWTKLREPWAMFAISIDSYQVLPAWAVELTARGLPWFELLLGVLLITGLLRRTAMLSTSLLLLVFFGLMIRALIKGMEIDCGCFGPGDRLSWVTLLRDGALLASSIWLTVIALRPGSNVPSRAVALPASKVAG
jgi:uncharacterized membrane protein YphA (DoxX/SURF4 family)